VRNRNKNVSLEDRLSRADISARSALDVFEQAAIDLETAAQAAQAVVDEAESEVMRLRMVRDDAFRRVALHQSKADKIRDLVK
jgi:hypothetical protein